MKKLFLLLLTIATFAIGADVKPLYFDNIAEDSATQQNQFDYMLQYKLYGTDYLKLGMRVRIPDKSGWNGSDGPITAGVELKLGGPVLTDSLVSIENDGSITSGPVRANTLTVQDRYSIAGNTCVANTTANVTRNCDSVPPAPVNLKMPSLDWPAEGYKDDIILTENNQEYIIDVSDTTNGKGMIDLYYHNIHTCVGGKNGCKIHVLMPPGGRLTRLFVDSLFIGNHTTINVTYNSDTGYVVQTQDKYRGNLLIYSNKNIIFDNTDNVPIQGSFISTSKIYLKCNLDFSGQLLANQLEIGNDFKGENFRFVKFDPDTLDFPELNKQGGLYEDNQTVIIPLQLSDTSTIDVYFTYCFDLKDGVTTDDFNMPPNIPVCGESSITTKIPIGSKTPVDTIKVNVKKDTLVEPNEYLVLHIDSISGAVLPNGETSGELKIKINDAPIGHVEFDTTYKYKFTENDTGFVDTIKTLNKTATTRFYLDSSFTDRYTLDSITGVLTLVGEPLDYEKAITDVVKITLTDTGNVKVTRNIPITVLDENEAPVLRDTNTTLPENLIHPFMVVKLVAEDVDTKPDFTENIFTMLEGDTSLFRVDSDGEVWAKKTFDYETDQKTHTIKVLVQDKNDPTLKDSATVTISITNSNDGPKFDKHDTTFYVKENEPFKDSVKATDQDGDKITYSIVGNVPFTIDSNGVITSTRTFDYEKEKEFTFKVVASDGTAKDTMNVTVKINDENEPVHTKDTTFTVEEGKTGEIGKVKGEDEDGKPVKFSCDDTVHYHVNPNTGAIGLVTPFDYEQTKSDTLKVFVTDGKFTDTAIVVINVKNVNETPVLQPNDTLTVPENCKDCEVGIITAIDPDGDKITYKVEEPGFYIESTGRLITTVPLDYEKDPVITITVIATDPSGASDTLTYTIKITDVNEPVHTKDTTCNIQENFVGRTGCKIEAWDDDGTKPTYKLTDSTNYTIDSNGEITVKKPLDFETKSLDTLKVIVSDGTFNDTAIVIIKVVDVPEKTQITEVDNKPKQDTIKTNKKDHTVDYTICEGTKCENHTIDVTVTKDTVVKVCNEKKTSCDNVVFLFNDTPPIVTLTNIESTTGTIDYITIEEQKDDQIYVNKKTNELTVIVRDTVNKKESHFNINVTLDTLPTEKIVLKDYPYIIDETKAQIVPIGEDKAEIVEVIKVNGVDVVVKQVIDLKTNKLIDSVQTVSYTTIINGKEVTVEYKTDMYTGKRVTDYEVSYNIDSCTVVSYTMNENKKIVKNEEGNIGYTITYNYIDDYGNKAVAMVSIVYDDIPPVVKILEPGEAMFKTNAIAVKWTINGMVQDTLNLQRLEPGANMIIRRFVDKAGNEAMDTVWVYMKEAKAIEIQVINPVTEINKEKVDEWYSDPTHTYNKKKPYSISFVKEDEEPDVIGIGFKVDIALPSVSPTGGLATFDDIVKNGRIPVDDQGNIVGASTKSIDVEEYVNDHCTEDFKQDYRKNGLNIPLYNVTYKLHLWVYSTTANYVNDYNIEYELNDQEVVSEAGTVGMVVDWIADKDGAVKAKNGHQLGTSAYITKLFSKSIAVNRCDYQTKKAGHRTVKKEETTTTFGYKRYTQKKK